MSRKPNISYVGNGGRLWYNCIYGDGELGPKCMEISSEGVKITAQRKENGWRLHILMVAVMNTTGHGKIDAFARALGENATNIGHILRGRSGISDRILRKCKDKYKGVTIDWLLTGDLRHLSPSMLHKLWRAEISLVVDGKRPPASLGHDNKINAVRHDLASEDLPT